MTKSELEISKTEVGLEPPRKNKGGYLNIPEALCIEFDQKAINLLLLADIMRYPKYCKSRSEIALMLHVDVAYVSKLLWELVDGGWIEEEEKYFSRVIYRPSAKATKYYRQPKSATRELDEIICTIHKILGGQRKPILSPTRRAKVQRRLKNFTKDQILTAANNLSKSKFHMGFNDQKTKYATVDFLLKNDERVEKWLNEDPENARMNEVKGRVF